MVRVLYILPSLNMNGGAEAYAINYFSVFDRSRVHVDFLIHGEPQEHNYIDYVKSLGSKVFLFPNVSVRTVSDIKARFAAILREERYDIVHSHMANSAFIYFPIAEKEGVKVRILHAHQAKAADKLSHAVRNYPLLFLGKKHSSDFAACGIKAGKYLFKKKKFTVFNNAIYPDKFSFSSSSRIEIRKKYSIPDSTLLLGHIGRFCRQKNQAFLVHLLRRLVDAKMDVKMMLIGAGEDYEKVVALANKIDVTNYIIFVGTTNQPAQFYSAFDALLLPSRYEGNPTVGIEATIAGLPVYASNRITDELNFAGNVTFLKLNVKKWVEEIRDFQIHRASRLPKPSSEAFDILVQAKKMENYYVNLCEGNTDGKR